MVFLERKFTNMAQFQSTSLIDYDIDDDRLIYISRVKGYTHIGTFTPEMQQIFKRAYQATHRNKRYDNKWVAPRPDCMILLADNEIVAINRYLMGKDPTLDLHNITSTAKRRQNLGENMINWLNQFE